MQAKGEGVLLFMDNIKVCNRCVMDNRSDETIKFDENGNCNYCNDALARINEYYFPNEEGKKKLNEMIDMLKREGKGKKYDCMMGLSGGLDSSYLAYLGYQYGLRILAIHIDDGFNSPIAEDNINKLSKTYNIDLIVEKPDSDQFFDLTRSFIMAGVPGIAIPQDNILTAYLYKYSRQNGIRYFLSGANFALESILQRGNAHNAADKVHIVAINKEFGRKGIDKLPLISLTQEYIINKYVYGIKVLRPLDLIDYNRERAIRELNQSCGFNYYGGKHYENIFTRFVQVYYLPRKFGVDKRTSHLSSLIVSGQMMREEALIELNKPLYDVDEMKKDIEFILGRLEISQKEFEFIMEQPPKRHDDYRISILNSLAGIARRYRKYLGE